MTRSRSILPGSPARSPMPATCLRAGSMRAALCAWPARDSSTISARPRPGTDPGRCPDLAERAMLFAGLMPNIKGPEAGRPLRLMPWQRLVFASLFGFVERETSARRFRQAVVYVPRGNGKTSIAAPLALYLSFLDGEGGAEGYAA